jgi:hypothetical protein
MGAMPRVNGAAAAANETHSSFDFRVKRAFFPLYLSVAAGQLILKISAEDQSVDHTNKLMGNNRDTIYAVISLGFSHEGDVCDWPFADTIE